MISRVRAIAFAAVLLATYAACRKEPASVEELYTTRTLALSYLRRNQLPEAEAEFQKLVKLAPDDPLGYADLGLTYLQAGRYPEAEKQLARARELDKSSVEIPLAQATFFALTTRPAESRETLVKLLADAPKNPQVLYALAELDAEKTDSASARAYEGRLRRSARGIAGQPRCAARAARRTRSAW